MHLKRRYGAYYLLAFTDVALMVLSYFLASEIYVGSARALGGLSEGRLAPLYGPATFALAAYACVIVMLYAFSRVYGCIYQGQMRTMVKRVFAINTLGVVMFAAVLYLLHLDDVSRMTLAIFYAISTAAIVLKNWIAWRVLLAMRNNVKRLVTTVVVGCGPLAQRYATSIKDNSTRLENVIGFIVPRDSVVEEISAALSNEACAVDVCSGFVRKESVCVESIYAESACCELGGCLGNVADLDHFLAHNSVDKIVIALDPSDYADVQSVMAMADKYGTMLDLVPFYNDVMPRRPDVDVVDDVKLVNLRSMPLSRPFNAAVKRLADIVISGLIIVAFSWLYAIVAIGVKVTSPGPVLFRQRRVGRNNKQFDMLKFRSMRVNNESNTAWSTDEDPRKTRFGSFIRKFSLDEFPQFFNVFVGDMSIVGPRPEIPYYVEDFRESVPRYMLRHQVRPGITGWAQVNGLRGDTSIEKRIEADLWYIENWSFVLDSRIFLRTIFGGFINSEKLVK